MKVLPTIVFCFLTIPIFAQSTTEKSMKDWKYPYEVHEVMLNDSTTLSYIDEGKGDTTLVFVHGLGSYLRGWQRNVDSLKTHFRCIALDLPGYGKSVDAMGSQTMDFFSNTMLQFLAQLDLNDVILIGHSMGGQIAIHTVLKDTARIQKLILTAPAGFETFTEKDKLFFKQVYTAAVIKATPVEQIQQNFKINFYNMPENANFMIDDRMYMRATKEYDRYCEMIPKCVLGMLEAPVFDRLPAIQLPTLVFYGKNDLLIPNKFLHPTLTTESVAKAGAAQIPNSQLLLIDQAGHFLQWEAAPQFNAAVMQFIRE